MSIFEKLMKLDRRWVFLFLVVVCVVAYAMPFTVPILVEPEVRSIFDFVEQLKPGAIIFIAIDYDPNSLAELHPMAYAMIEQAWRQKKRIIFTALSQNGPGMADQLIRDVSDSLKVEKEYNGVVYPPREIVNGIDYAFLGYKPYYGLVILGMGQDFRIPFPSDYYGTPLDSLPMMQGVINYGQVDLVVDLSSGNITDAWINYGQGRFGFPLALGLTGVSTAQYYPYLGSGQVLGIMGGLLGAAQYEYLADNPGRAMDGMKVQLWAHIVIILFIVMGNVGFFASRRRQKREGGQ
ncbi:MAG TPA: hypothetical protein PK186_06145 [candidate division Zixibacteria bacterium]|nr:hypothetical protein [candidate division Zixibacteria bacterium]MDD4918534.1 hypothetical protein [candidate division Zixibacteria bacterium]MDM7973404.1 hypothetical protein [candidate division Zixibacteria bacterium]HOD66903.1 hypothetical protein [candidate division Zixibacteria bacterium]HPM37123.1 hypothetical protein [candidate division Zixibacteria bacterium]